MGINVETYIKALPMCDKYKDKFGRAISKRDMFNIMCDINGLGYLCGIDESNKHYVLPYEEMVNKFGSYINGAYIANLDGYTSKLYCCYCDTEPIKADTSLLGIFGCGDVTVNVPDNAICRLYLDRNSRATVNTGEGSICICNYAGDTVRWQGKGKFIPRRYGE